MKFEQLERVISCWAGHTPTAVWSRAVRCAYAVWWCQADKLHEAEDEEEAEQETLEITGADDATGMNHT